MKRILLFVSLVFAYYQAQAQFPTPVSWSAKWEAVSANEYDLIFTAEIDPGWNIYSQYLESDDGPIATRLNFTSPSGLERQGEPTEAGTIKEGYDEIFEMNVTKLFDKAVITQRVQLAELPQVIEGYITYMVCDKEQCLPPTDYEFSLQITAAPGNPEADESGASLQVDTAPADAPTGSPVQWSASVKSLGNEEYELIWTADFPEPWTLYSQHIEGDGPIPTSFALDAGAHYELRGATSERAEKSKAGFDELFGIEVKKFVTGPAVFTQKNQVA
jgi:thiol:disulfide interchange protein DsbD